MTVLTALRPPKAHVVIMAAALMSAWYFSRLPQLAPASGAASLNESQPPEASTSFELYHAESAPLEPLLERPLLAQGRTVVLPSPQVVAEEAPPAAAEIEAAPPPPERPPQIVLKGLAETAGKRRALLVWGAGTGEVWYAVGAEKDGWRIVAIERQSVLIANGGQEITVNLFRD